MGSSDPARQVRLLQTLHEVATQIAASSDIESGLQQLVDEIAGHFQFSTVGIGVVEADEIVYRGVVSDKIPRNIRFPLDRSIAARVVRSGIGELINDVSSNPEYVRLEDSVEQELCVPIVVSGLGWGVLNMEAGGDATLGAEEYDIRGRIRRGGGRLALSLRGHPPRRRTDHRRAHQGS